MYAAELIKQKLLGTWDIKATVEKANRASAISSAKVGYHDAVPWADQLEEFDAEPLYDTIDELKKKPDRRARPSRPRAPGPMAEPRH